MSPGRQEAAGIVWVLTSVEVKGRKASNDLSGGIEPLASFCDSVIFRVCGVDSFTKIDKISKIILQFPAMNPGSWQVALTNPL